MFCKASFFNQNIGSWNVFRVANIQEMLFWLKNDASSNMCDISGTLDNQDQMSWWKDDALLNMDFMVLTLDTSQDPMGTLNVYIPSNKTRYVLALRNIPSINWICIRTCNQLHICIVIWSIQASRPKSTVTTVNQLMLLCSGNN
jgi:hypothetical protein